MNESRLTYLFKAYFAKSATPVEYEELMELLKMAENEVQVKALLTEEWQQFKSENQHFSERQYEVMLSNIFQKGAERPTALIVDKYIHSFKWLRTVAAAVLVFLIGGVAFWLHTGKQARQVVQSEEMHIATKDSILPGGNKAILTLSDGSSIILDSIHQGTLTQQGNTNVRKVNTSTLVYSQQNNIQNQKIAYNTLSTPKGGQYQLVLPDGTKVWLNASSSIYFPTVFEGKERNVTISGEAYFEVAKNPEMPFNVKVKSMNVQVLGTHFNIMAYNDENSINTTLLEGSVKVSEGSLNRILISGQQSKVYKTGQIEIEEADIAEVMAWKNGWFQFNGNDIETIMRQISRWYDVEILYEGRIPTSHFSGLVRRTNDISQVLKIMETGGVKFKIEGRKVIVLSSG